MKKTEYIIIILSILFAVLDVAAYQFWESFPKGYFYKLDALAWILCTRAFYLLSILALKEKLIGSVLPTILFISFLLSIQNGLDEFFFQNISSTIHEVIAAALIILITIIKNKTWIK